MASTWKRWTPAVVAVVAVAAAAIDVPLAANASSPLAPKTAKQVIAMIVSSKVTSLTGTIEQTSDLGLPSIPSTGSSSSSASSGTSAGSIMELLTGTHTAKLYLDGATKQRVQVLDSAAERDLVRNGSTVWIYDSKKHTAVETTLPSKAHKLPAGAGPSAKLGISTPSDVATKLLAALKSTSDVSVGGDLGVAGRSAYDLVLKPKASDTLLGSISIAVDSQTGLPLRVDVTARGASAPAIRVGFTQLSLSKPSASIFAFTPPSDATVTKKDVSRHHPFGGKHPSGTASGSKTPAKGTKPTTKVTGSGWDAVVTITAKDSKSLTGSLTSNPLYSQLSTPVSGGRAFSTTLFTVLVMDDGRVLVGSVPLSRLQTVASAS